MKHLLSWSPLQSSRHLTLNGVLRRLGVGILARVLAADNELWTVSLSAVVDADEARRAVIFFPAAAALAGVAVAAPAAAAKFRGSAAAGKQNHVFKRLRYFFGNYYIGIFLVAPLGKHWVTVLSIENTETIEIEDSTSVF